MSLESSTLIRVFSSLPEGTYIRNCATVFKDRSDFACSDTTAATLSFIAYEFCKNPNVQAKLRKAIDAAANGKDHLDVEDVQNIPYLDGVINEALRLHPAVCCTPRNILRQND
jgi:hypothetical protein